MDEIENGGAADGVPVSVTDVDDYITPWPIMALATFMKPAMLAPFM